MKTNYTFLTNKKLILNLIKDDLKNTRLVAGLSELGFDTGKYYLSLGESIIGMLSLDDKALDEKLWEAYSDNLSAMVQTDIFENPGKLDFLAQALFLKLIGERTRLEQEAEE